MIYREQEIQKQELSVDSKYTPQGLLIKTIDFMPEKYTSQTELEDDNYLSDYNNSYIKQKLSQELSKIIMDSCEVDVMDNIRDPRYKTYRASISILSERDKYNLNRKIESLKGDLLNSNMHKSNLEHDLNNLKNQSLFELIRMWFYMKFKKKEINKKN